MPTEYHLTVAARFENIPGIMEFVTEGAEEAGLDEQAVFHCRMATDEACANIVEHAYGGEDKGDIEVTVRVEPGVCTTTLVDSGRPFDPSSVPPPPVAPDPATIKPGGLGLHLMRKIMDEVSFSFTDGRNVLTMVKRQASPPPTPPA